MNVSVDDKSLNHRSGSERGRILVVDDDTQATGRLAEQLSNLGFYPLISRSGKQAVELLEGNQLDMVFMKSFLPDMECKDLILHMKAQVSEVYLPVVLLVSESGDQTLPDYMDAGADDFMYYNFTNAELNARILAIEQLCELQNSYKDTIHEQVVAKQILTAALSARNVGVEGVQVLSRSAAIFSGDLVLSARNPDGGLDILLADFTGHGLSAAVGVLPVADMFCVMCEKGFGPEIILRNINSKLHTLLPTGMFMSACMVEINSSLRSACVWNSGMPDVYLLDGKTGLIKQRIKSTHIPLGINEEINDRLKFDDLDIAPDDLFVMYSDGLTDVVDPYGEMFGADRLQRIIEEEDNLNAFNAVVSEFDQFCRGQVLSDDATLVTIACGENLNRSLSQHTSTNSEAGNNNKGGWRFMIEVSGSSLREIDPVPIVLDQYSKLDDLVVGIDHLQRVLTELYDNALDHGVLELSHVIDVSMKDSEFYQQERQKRFDRIPYGFVRIELQKIVYQGNASLLLRMEDSGRGFDHAAVLSRITDQNDTEQQPCNSGISLVKNLCRSVYFQGRGNRVEVIVGRQQQSDV